MEVLANVFVVVGLLGFLLSVMISIVALVRKKRAALWGISLVACLILLIAGAVLLSRPDTGEKATKEVATIEKKRATPKSEKPVRKKSQLTLGSDDILIDKRLYKGALVIVTQCYAENKTDEDWEDSVKMTVYNTSGDVIHSPWDAAWPEICIKAGERDYLSAKIPVREIKGMYTGNTVVIRWEWGKQKVEQRFEL